MSYARPDALEGKTVKVPTPCQPIYVTMSGENGGPPTEVWLKTGKNGQCIAGLLSTMGRMVTLALQSGATIEEVAKELALTGCPRTTMVCPQSCLESVACVLREEVSHSGSTE